MATPTIQSQHMVMGAHRTLDLSVSGGTMLPSIPYMPWVIMMSSCCVIFRMLNFSSSCASVILNIHRFRLVGPSAPRSSMSLGCTKEPGGVPSHSSNHDKQMHGPTAFFLQVSMRTQAAKWEGSAEPSRPLSWVYPQLSPTKLL